MLFTVDRYRPVARNDDPDFAVVMVMGRRLRSRCEVQYPAIDGCIRKRRRWRHDAARDLAAGKRGSCEAFYDHSAALSDHIDSSFVSARLPALSATICGFQSMREGQACVR